MRDTIRGTLALVLLLGAARGARAAVGTGVDKVLPFIQDDYAQGPGRGAGAEAPALHRGLGALVTHLSLDEGLRLH